MNSSKQQRTIFSVVAAIVFLVSGSAFGASDQKFVSAMTISSDCGVEDKMRSSGGPPVTAARETVETDWERVQPGYVLLEPTAVKESYLLGVDKEIAGSYSGDYYPKYTQLLPNGHRLYSSKAKAVGLTNGGGSATGCIEEYDANGELVWRVSLNNDYFLSHHAIRKLDNGNVLAQIWQKSSAADAISQGRNPEFVPEDGDFWFDGIIEVNPMTMEVVWEWNVKHHLIQNFDAQKSNFGVVSDHPELLDINQFAYDEDDGSIHPDWIHANAIDYNEELDQIIVSFRSLNEVLIIDHSTTPREASGHSGGDHGKGGDFLYRFGNPKTYGRGTADDQTLYNQHDVQWIRSGLPGAGNLLIFNNGDPDLRPYTTIVEFSPERNPDGSYVLEDGQAYGPKELVWEYNPVPEERFLAGYISGAQRMPNGNTFINAGAIGFQREVTSSGDIVWEYEFKNEMDVRHSMFRAEKHPPDYPGLVGLISQDE